LLAIHLAHTDYLYLIDSQHARRKSTKRAYLASRRNSNNNKKRGRKEAFAEINGDVKMNGFVSGTNGINGNNHDSPVASEDEPPKIAGVTSLKDPPPAALKDPPSTSLKDAPCATINDINAENQHDNSNNDCNSTSACDPDAMITEEVEPFKVLQHGGAKLDMYAYHRGREGRELRDESTGELLCGDVEPSDTNH